MIMPTRRNVVFSVAILILAALLANRAVQQHRAQNNLSALQQRVDEAFRTQLSLAASSLGTDFDEDESNFNACVASVSAAAALAGQTSFESRNDVLDVALDRFGKILLNPVNRQAVTQNAPTLRALFVKLSADPADADTTRQLSAFTGNVR
ncbi:hypothetical protein I8J29_15645 [Paenibacillus sp. MWE-103]|uniref:Uncharacterized protein n=1 Tax=Paenibacillus artemisiicola TaxID=1172618 RepID=A0ABS3WBF2_9BACL|nr:hypothetical protein [Paenibacillus artemisiicola]MBO7745644.1 hypothetical protein [Paenibacillus artemisiicola]